jgi:hypothetical protein
VTLSNRKTKKNSQTMTSFIERLEQMRASQKVDIEDYKLGRQNGVVASLAVRFANVFSTKTTAEMLDYLTAICVDCSNSASDRFSDISPVMQLANIYMFLNGTKPLSYRTASPTDDDLANDVEIQAKNLQNIEAGFDSTGTKYAQTLKSSSFAAVRARIVTLSRGYWEQFGSALITTKSVHPIIVADATKRNMSLKDYIKITSPIIGFFVMTRMSLLEARVFMTRTNLIILYVLMSLEQSKLVEVYTAARTNALRSATEEFDVINGTSEDVKVAVEIGIEFDYNSGTVEKLKALHNNGYAKKNRTAFERVVATVANYVPLPSMARAPTQNKAEITVESISDTKTDSDADTEGELEMGASPEMTEVVEQFDAMKVAPSPPLKPLAKSLSAESQLYRSGIMPRRAYNYPLQRKFQEALKERDGPTFVEYTSSEQGGGTSRAFIPFTELKKKPTREFPDIPDPENWLKAPLLVFKYSGEFVIYNPSDPKNKGLRPSDLAPGFLYRTPGTIGANKLGGFKNSKIISGYCVRYQKDDADTQLTWYAADSIVPFTGPISDIYIMFAEDFSPTDGENTYAKQSLKSNYEANRPVVGAGSRRKNGVFGWGVMGL